MAYDRFDPPRNRGRDRFEPESNRDRYSDDDSRRWRGEGRDDDRGWFERAGEQISSWFGDEDDDHRRGSRDHYGAGRREPVSRRSEPWGGGRSDTDRDLHDRDRYRPMAGDYGRSEPIGRGGGRSFEDRQRQPRSGSSSSQGIHDPHYNSLRQRHIEELDRDYDDYRRENQSRFESEFGSWRERRSQKRSLLGTVREHMEVVGNDDQPVGTVDRVAGDKIILTKSDPEAGGSHHSISCTNIDRIEDNRVILDCGGDDAKSVWRNEDRDRALGEREDQGEAGPHMLNRSFEGTYR